MGKGLRESDPACSKSSDTVQGWDDGEHFFIIMHFFARFFYLMKGLKPFS